MLCELIRGLVMIRTYSDLAELPSYIERYRYLKMGGKLGEATFGYDRIFNQRFYHSAEWKQIRDHVIVRDNGCDLGVYGYEIHGKILVHHMNPLTMDDLKHGGETVLDPEFLICVTHNTHNAIHYGDENLLPLLLPERVPGDTMLWTR